MNADEFSWHPVSPHSHGQLLRRGGPFGDVYAAVTAMEGEPWLAILNLHKDTTKVRSVPCDSEMEAIQAVECWLEGLLASER